MFGLQGKTIRLTQDSIDNSNPVPEEPVVTTGNIVLELYSGQYNELYSENNGKAVIDSIDIDTNTVYTDANGLITFSNIVAGNHYIFTGSESDSIDIGGGVTNVQVVGGETTYVTGANLFTTDTPVFSRIDITLSEAPTKKTSTDNTGSVFMLMLMDDLGAAYNVTFFELCNSDQEHSSYIPVTSHIASANLGGDFNAACTSVKYSEATVDAALTALDSAITAYIDSLSLSSVVSTLVTGNTIKVICTGGYSILFFVTTHGKASYSWTAI